MRGIIGTRPYYATTKVDLDTFYCRRVPTPSFSRSTGHTRPLGDTTPTSCAGGARGKHVGSDVIRIPGQSCLVVSIRGVLSTVPIFVLGFALATRTANYSQPTEPVNTHTSGRNACSTNAMASRLAAILFPPIGAHVATILRGSQQPEISRARGNIQCTSESLQ